jgi:hypothetical protein
MTLVEVSCGLPRAPVAPTAHKTPHLLGTWEMIHTEWNVLLARMAFDIILATLAEVLGIVATSEADAWLTKFGSPE